MQRFYSRMNALPCPVLGSLGLIQGPAESKTRAFNWGQHFTFRISNHRFVSNFRCCHERSFSKMETTEATSAAALAFGNPTDEQLMQTYTPPDFLHSYPVKVHPKYSSSLFREKFEKWLQHHKVDTIFTPKMYQMLLRMNIPAFVSRIYPEAPEWGLEWACKFFIMLWIWDDILDATEIGKSPEKALSPLLDLHLLMMWTFPDDPVLRDGLDAILNYFEGQAREAQESYFESVLAEARTQPGTVYSKPTSSIQYGVYLEFWKDVVANASPEFCLRYAQSNHLWFLGCLRESEIRHFKTVPSSIDDYIQMRKKTSAVPVCLVLTDFVYELNSPDSWFSTREAQNVLDATNDIVSWHNDLWSFKREVLVEKDIGNMILANSVHRKISYTEAAEVTLQMVYDRILEFERAVKDLESVTSPEYRRNFETYVMTCRFFISGTHDWHSSSVRYQ